MDYQCGDFVVLKGCIDPDYDGILVRIAEPLRLRILADGRRVECYVADIRWRGSRIAVQAHQIDRPRSIEHRLSVVPWSSCFWRPNALHTKVAMNMLALKPFSINFDIKRDGYHD